jgi:nucleotide-binding universal stress UspA family protein
MLPEIKTILYASDLGKNTRPAMRLAASIAKQHNARVVYLHVLEPLADTARALVGAYYSDEDIDAKYQESLESTRVYMERRIGAFHQEEMGDTEAPFETAVMAKSVMGSRTHSMMGRMMMGSSATKIVHTSKIPVLVVPLTQG